MKKNSKLHIDKKEKVLKVVNIVSYVLNGVFLLLLILGLVGMSIPKKESSETSAITEPVKHNQINPPMSGNSGYYELEEGYYTFRWANWSQYWFQYNPGWSVEVVDGVISIPRFYRTYGELASGFDYAEQLIFNDSYFEYYDLLSDDWVRVYDDFAEVSFYALDCLIRVPNYATFSYVDKIDNLSIYGSLLYDPDIDNLWIDRVFNIYGILGGSAVSPYVSYVDDNYDLVGPTYVYYSAYRGLFKANGVYYRGIALKYLYTKNPSYYDIDRHLHSETLTEPVLVYDSMWYVTLDGQEICVNSAYFELNTNYIRFDLDNRVYGSLWSSSHYTTGSTASGRALMYQRYGYLTLYTCETRLINRYSERIGISYEGSYNVLPLSYSYMDIISFISNVRVDGDINNDAISNLFLLFKALFDNLSSFFSIQLFRGFTIATFVFLPLFVGILLFIVNLFKR